MFLSNVEDDVTDEMIKKKLKQTYDSSLGKKVNIIVHPLKSKFNLKSYFVSLNVNVPSDMPDFEARLSMEALTNSVDNIVTRLWSGPNPKSLLSKGSGGSTRPPKATSSDWQ